MSLPSSPSFFLLPLPPVVWVKDVHQTAPGVGGENCNISVDLYWMGNSGRRSMSIMINQGIMRPFSKRSFIPRGAAHTTSQLATSRRTCSSRSRSRTRTKGLSTMALTSPSSFSPSFEEGCHRGLTSFHIKPSPTIIEDDSQLTTSYSREVKSRHG